MLSALDVVFFAPKLCFSLLAGITDSCLNLAKSAYTRVTDSTHSAISAVYQVWSYFSDFAGGAVRLFTQSCLKKPCYLPSVIAEPLLSLANTINYALQSITTFPSRLKTVLSFWMTYVFWRAVLWLTPTFWVQLYSNLVSWCRNLPSRARKYTLAACISISKGSVQLLWNCSFALCTTFHALLIVLLTGPATDSPLDTQVLLLPCSSTRSTCFCLTASVSSDALLDD